MTHEVIVVGAGLSGLAACYELEQRGIPYLLVEVKRQVGGSFATVQQDGFTIDRTAFAVLNHFPDGWLASLGLENSLFEMREGIHAFERGVAQLVDALSAKLTGARMMRTAVSTIGEVEGRWGVCLENGVMLNAKRVIVAAPARYAARMFATSIPEITAQLVDYHYDDILRVSLGYRAEDIKRENLRFYREPAYVFHHRTEHFSRVPVGHTLLQIGVRLHPDRTTPEKLIAYLTKEVVLPPQPVTHLMSYWAEADPLSLYDPQHSERLATIAAHTPATLALIGSDYTTKQSPRVGVVRLDERIEMAKAAVNKVLV
jgi:protoporphyrinogen oxidase